MSWLNIKTTIDEDALVERIKNEIGASKKLSKPQFLTEPAPHYPTVLDIPTYHGTGSNCHPDVLRIPEGFGPQGFTYWMAMTPMGTFYENPSIVAGFDGLNWEV